MIIRNFVINCFKFLGIFSLICLVSIIFNSLLINYQGYQIEQNKNVLILGDSHTEFAIDDAIFKNSINFSHSADSYYYSFLKLRKLKKENPQIDTLLLALSNHNLLIDYDDRWLFNTAHIKSKLRIYIDLMDFSDFTFLLKSNPSAVIQGLIEAPKYSVKLLFRGSLKQRDLGKFQPSERNKLDKDILQRKNDKIQRALEYSKFEMNHLKRIVDFCKKNDIELIFIGTPVHPEYIKLKQQELDLFQSYYKSNLSDFLYLDFTNFKVPDAYFQDSDHLNTLGAKLFTKSLINKMRNK